MCKRLTRRCQMWQLRDEALEKAKAEVREQTALLRVERLHNKLDEINTDRYGIIYSSSIFRSPFILLICFVFY